MHALQQSRSEAGYAARYFPCRMAGEKTFSLRVTASGMVLMQHWTNDHREWYRTVYLKSQHWLIALNRIRVYRQALFDIRDYLDPFLCSDSSDAEVRLAIEEACEGARAAYYHRVNRHNFDYFPRRRERAYRTSEGYEQYQWRTNSLKATVAKEKEARASKPVELGGRHRYPWRSERQQSSRT